MKRRFVTAVVTVAVVVGMVPAHAADSRLVKLDGYQVSNKKQADKHLDGTSKSFRQYVVSRVGRMRSEAKAALGDDYAAAAASCKDGGSKPVSIASKGYHRRGLDYAIGDVNNCVGGLGYGVIWRRRDSGWREVVYIQALPSCEKLRKNKVPVSLYRRMQSHCDNGTEYVEYTG